MSSFNNNSRDAITCGVVWIACLAMLIAIELVSGLNTFVFASFPLIFFMDLAIWLVYSLLRLPCGFVEWVCYPFWPFKWHGFPMRVAVIIRIVEIITILLSGHWLWETVKAIF